MKTAPETIQKISIDASGIYYRDLNTQLKGIAGNGTKQVELHNVYGQRYIGTSLNAPMEIEIYGTPGNDLGAFMDGPRITVYGNAQDGCGNTMNNGEIIVHGHAGDITGLSARGGRIFIRDSVGYRAGIHMKEYQDKKPVVVIGGTAQDFLGEYMAGGVLLLLGLNGGGEHKARFIGTGMHGGTIYIRGSVDNYQLGSEVGIAEPGQDDWPLVKKLVIEFARHFNYNADEILKGNFIKLFPLYLRPYGRIYTP
jgi:glutamate synthase domain-containing protein 3